MVVVTLVAMVAIAGAGAYSLGIGGQTASDTSSSSMSTTTLIKAGATQALPYMHGVPVCYDIQFNLTSSGTLSGGFRATGMVNWYILSMSGQTPVTGSVVSGTISQSLPAGPWVLELCNQQHTGMNVTITEPFVAS